MINYKPVDFDPFQGHEYLFSAATTEAQQEIFATIIMEPQASCAFNESLTIRFNGVLNPVALKYAIEQILQRHDALRCSFSPDGTQWIVSCAADIDISQYLFETDLSTASPEAQQKSVTDLAQREVEHRFDLLNGPLIRFVLLSLSSQETVLILTAHHIVCDGWSTAVLIEDLGNYYNLHQTEASSALPPAYPFSRYARLKQRERKTAEYEKSQRYWLDQYQTIPDFDLPNDYPRPAQRSYPSKRIDYEIPLDLINTVTHTGAKQGCSLVNTLFAAFNVLIYAITQQREPGDLVIGMPAAEQSILGQYYLIGHCVNMLAIKTRIDTNQSFIEYLEAVKQQVLNAYEHQNYTFGSLLQQISIDRDPSRIPLMPVTFNLDQKIESQDFNWHKLQVSYSSNPRAYENFELFVNASKGDGKFVLEAQYNTDLFKAETILTWMSAYESLLKQIVDNPQQKIASLTQSLAAMFPAVPNLLQWINQTQTAYPRINRHPAEQLGHPLGNQLGVHHLIHTQAQQTPDKTAVIDEYQQQLSYQQLDELSSQFAHGLIQYTSKQASSASNASNASNASQPGYQNRPPIGLCMHRSVNMLVALLGIWKSGAGYVPLDPYYPEDRLQYMIENSGMRLIITEKTILETTFQAAQSTQNDEQSSLQSPVFLAYESLQTEFQQLSTDFPQSMDFNPQQIAYIIYTSGSTGNPKGVTISQKNAVNFLQSMAQRPGLQAEDKLLAVTTISFDIAVLELYLPLIVGAQVVITQRETAIDGERLAELIEQYAITCLQATPMTWRLLLAAGWQGNKKLKMLCGGEPFPNDLAQTLLGRVASLWNMYGPTETTVWSTCYPITDPKQPIYIGRPIANTQVYVLDKSLNPCRSGQVGDLYIGGDGLALGYLGAEALTQEKFIPNPFSSGPDAKIYHTGDLARYHSHGQLECLGRSDSQIKLRGYRIELGEIHSVIVQHPAISQCVVKLIEIDGDKQIAAYVILHPSEPLEQTAIRAFARKKLPEYMIPSYWVKTDDFPKTLNGKIDRKALPLPTTHNRLFSRDEKNGDITTPQQPVNGSPQYQTSYQPLNANTPSRQAALTASEQLIIQVFQQILGVEQVAIHDNFFELGGHSLLSVRVIQQLKRHCSHRITPRMMLTDNVAQLATQLDLPETSDNRHNSRVNHDSKQKLTSTDSPHPATESSQAFFFDHPPIPGQSERQQLYGIYYPALKARDTKPTAVLLLYPIQQEYMRCHWGFKHLAKQLAKQGIPVLKFDYFGSGDSGGDSAQYHIEQCLKDIALAEEQLKQRAGIESITLIGLRLGASLAALYAHQHPVDQLILWEPVISGKRHLKELNGLQRQLTQRIKENASFLSRLIRRFTPPKDELLGYPFSSRLYRQLQQLELSDWLTNPDQHTDIIYSHENDEIRLLKEHLIKPHTHCRYQHVDEAINWTDLDQYLNQMIPHNSLNQITRLLSGDNHE